MSLLPPTGLEIDATRAQQLREAEAFFSGRSTPGLLPPLVKPRMVEKAPEAPAEDLLTAMYSMQKALDERICIERGIEKTLDEWVIGLTIAMESEIDEIRREVEWKWWKNPKPLDSDALQGEVIDMWHFLLSLSRVVGLSPADIHRVYMEKNAENHARQSGTSEKDGYKA